MIASLDKIDLKLKSIKIGLTDAKQINQMIAGGLTSAWDRFAESVAMARRYSRRFGTRSCNLRRTSSARSRR